MISIQLLAAQHVPTLLSIASHAFLVLRIYTAHISQSDRRLAVHTDHSEHNVSYLIQSGPYIRPYYKFDPLHLCLDKHDSKMLIFRRIGISAEELHIISL